MISHSDANISVFKFSDYLVALSLVVVLYSSLTGGELYNFRIKVSGLPIKGFFIIMIAVGLLSLATDAYFSCSQTSHMYWQLALAIQVVLAIIFCIPVFGWIYYAFICTSKFNIKKNSKHKIYYEQVEEIISNGEADGIKMLAKEIGFSAENIISAIAAVNNPAHESAKNITKLMSRKNFCDQVARSYANTALSFFKSIKDNKVEASKLVGDCGIGSFANNISFYFVSDKDSILYNTAGVGQEMIENLYGNYYLIEAICCTNVTPSYIYNIKPMKLSLERINLTFDNYLDLKLYNSKHSYSKCLNLAFQYVAKTGSFEYSSANVSDSTYSAFKDACAFFQNIIRKIIANNYDKDSDLFAADDAEDPTIFDSDAEDRTIFDSIAEAIATLAISAARINVAKVEIVKKIQYEIFWCEVIGYPYNNKNKNISKIAKKFFDKLFEKYNTTSNSESANIKNFSANLESYLSQEGHDINKIYLDDNSLSIKCFYDFRAKINKE